MVDCQRGYQITTGWETVASVRVNVNPELLIWACDRAGIHAERSAKRSPILWTGSKVGTPDAPAATRLRQQGPRVGRIPLPPFPA